MSKNPTQRPQSNGGNTASLSPSQKNVNVNDVMSEQFRKETEEATAQDLMMEPALMAPAKVPAVAASEISGAPEKEARMAGKSGANAGPAAEVPTSAMPYIGAADGPATAVEIAKALAEVLGPALKAMSPDPERQMEATGRLVEEIVKRLREPSDEEKEVLRRKKIARDQLIREQFEMIVRKRQIEDMCPHERGTVDGKSHTTVTALHNYIDGVLRGTCSLCQKIIEPGDPSFRMVVMSHNLAMESAR